MHSNMFQVITFLAIFLNVFLSVFLSVFLNVVLSVFNISNISFLRLNLLNIWTAG